MTVVSALRCDHRDDRDSLPLGTSRWAAALALYRSDRIECQALSRDARTPGVLDVVTERDGWVTTTDGRHLCPEHAAAEGGAAA
jgi:hypothetical protein